MGKVNVYLPNDLERAVRAAGLSISAICQTALQRELARLDRLRTTGQAPFTPRLAVILDELRTGGRDVTASDLLGGILLNGDNLGAHALAAMGVDLPVPRGTPRPATGGRGDFAPDAIEALTAAYKVALEMRHEHLGTEHVVIAMAAGDSPFHDMFVVLDVTDRLLRQQVERMIANPWTTDHVTPADDPAELARLNREIQRLSAELDRLSGGDA